MRDKQKSRGPKDLDAWLDDVKAVLVLDRGTLLIAAAVFFLGIHKSRAFVVGHIAPLEAVYDSFLIVLFLSFAAAFLLLWYVRSNGRLSRGLDRCKYFVQYDERFGLVLGAISILLGLKAWNELVHLSLFGIDASQMNPNTVGGAWYLNLLLPDLEVIFWGGLSALAGWRCRERYLDGSGLALAGMVLSISAVVVSFTPLGDVLPLITYTMGW